MKSATGTVIVYIYIYIYIYISVKYRANFRDVFFLPMLTCIFYFICNIKLYVVILIYIKYFIYTVKF